MNALYQVIGVSPDGTEEIGLPRPRAEAMRIFDAVVRARTATFQPHNKTRVKVVAVTR